MHADFADYYRWHYPRLVGFLRVLGAPLDEAADVAQQVLGQLAGQWEQVTGPRAWSCIAAMSLLARRGGGSGVRSDPVRSDPVRSDLVRSAGEGDGPGEQEFLRQLSGLPPVPRQIIAWKLMEFAPDEIAAGLRLSPEAVRAGLAEARKALRPYLAGTGSGAGR